MDVNKLVEVLRATLDPNQREEAEKQLEIVRFCERTFLKNVENNNYFTRLTIYT